jgi:putative SOS response-associated peptidase YedK
MLVFYPDKTGRQFVIIALMCGRYRLSRGKQLVEEHFASVSEECEWSPRYNVAPTQLVLTIRQDSASPSGSVAGSGSLANTLYAAARTGERPKA